MANRLYHPGKRLDRDILEQMRSMYRAGEKYVTIEHALGVSDCTIRKYCIPRHAKHESSAKVKETLTKKGLNHEDFL